MYTEIDEDAFYQRLGEAIRSLREAKKIKQDALAAHLGFSRVSISNIETGKQKIQLHSLIRLANYFKVGIDELIPSPKYQSKDISILIETKVYNAESFKSKEALEKVKEFIRISTSNNTRHVPG